MYYVIVNKETGELEDNCSVCSVGACFEDADLRAVEQGQCDDAHMVCEVTIEEYRALQSEMDMKEVVRMKRIYDPETGRTTEMPLRRRIPSYAFKVDVADVSRRVEGRRRVRVPVEAEGIGGREVIAFDEKPVGILRRRVSVVEKKGV